MNGDGVTLPVAGSPFDDGVDWANFTFNQSAAFTCNIVAAKVARCVKGPAYTAGLPSGIGQWLSGSTYISYGDDMLVTSRAQAMLGYVGGQSFPFTPGSGYTNGTTTPTVTCSGGGTPPIISVTVSGGSIVNVVPTYPGLGLVSTCTVALPAGGSGGAIPAIQLAPFEGVGGVAYPPLSNNMMGTIIYDNSCSSTLNRFFASQSGGCFEPGLPLRPFGQFIAAKVSG